MRSRKPPGLSGVWANIRARGARPWTVPEVARGTRVTRATAAAFVDRLARAGIVTPAHDVHADAWRLAVDRGPTLPRISGDGKERIDPAEPIWRTLRAVGGPVTAAEIASLATTPACFVSERVSKAYLDVLVKAGFVRAAGRGACRRYAGLPHRFTGGRPPRVVTAVYDPNVGRVAWSQT